MNKVPIDTYWVTKTKLQEFNPFGYTFIYLGVLDPSDYESAITFTLRSFPRQALIIFCKGQKKFQTDACKTHAFLKNKCQ